MDLALMAQVASESRNRVGIVWYDDEDEANDMAVIAVNDPAAGDANFGIVQVGRDPGFDKEIDGKMAYAVVIP